MTHSSTKEILSRLSVTPNRTLGQNFLTDRNVAEWIVNALRPSSEDTIIEVGPGIGALTEHVLDRCRQLVLIEKDPALASYHSQQFSERDDVSVVEGDAVQFDVRPWFKEQPLKVLGALPYSSGTEIVRTFMHNPSPVSRAVFTLQKEVCERLAAQPRTKAYGKISVRVQARWQVEVIKQLPPHLFHPRPKVDSAVILLTPRKRSELPTFDELLLDRLVRLGFSQRRKQLRKLLPEPPMAWDQLTTELDTSPTCRAEELSLRQWVELTNLYDDHPLKNLPQSGDELFDVVDSNNNVIEQRPRCEVHAKNLHHRAVHILVLDHKGNLFLQKRSHLKDAFPSAWDSSAAGHLDVGESYLDCAVRELQEELGIETSADSLTHHATIPSSENTGWEFVELYSIHYKGKLRFPCSEVECGAWFPIEEVKAWGEKRPQDFAAGFLECLKRFDA